MFMGFKPILLTLFAAIFSFVAGAEDELSSLIDVEVSVADQEILFALGKIKDLREVLTVASQKFPDLRFVVLRDGDHQYGELLEWYDPRVSRMVNRTFELNLSKFDWNIAENRTLGTFLDARDLRPGFSGRPLATYDVILLSNRIPRRAVFHELVHYLIARAYRAQSISQSGVRIQTKQLVHALGGEYLKASALLREMDSIDVKVFREFLLIGLKFWLGSIQSHRFNFGEETEVTQFIYLNQAKLGIPAHEALSELRYGHSHLKKLLSEVQRVIDQVHTMVNIKPEWSGAEEKALMRQIGGEGQRITSFAQTRTDQLFPLLRKALDDSDCGSVLE